MSATDSPADDDRARLRDLPSVRALAEQVLRRRSHPTTHVEATSAARTAIAHRRAMIQDGDASEVEDLAATVIARLDAAPRRVLNGTGVVLHTNLGRAPLAQAALDAIAETAGGYVDLELDLATGERGGRGRDVEELLRELTGAEAALVVNNGAAATLLACAAVAGPGASLVVSRGQLIEIGGGFRIPEIVAQSGAHLEEVGTTNRTRQADYEDGLSRAAADDRRGVILRVHPSNFRTVGFVSEVGIAELTQLGAPVIDDIGTGLLHSHPWAVGEPTVGESIAADATIVCFSGDKLIGGPQAGLLVGRAWAVDACRAHPLARALRVGRLALAALHATLALHRDPDRAHAAIPTLAMLTTDPAILLRRAREIATAVEATVADSTAVAGGGTLPTAVFVASVVCLRSDASPSRLAAALRAGRPPLVSRIEQGRVIVDPRTISDDELPIAIDAIRAALHRTKCDAVGEE